MNQAPENETESIRSEIDDTRRRMDNTMGAIGDRLQGRHLIDEVLGFFRSDNPSGSEFREKISQTASSAAGSIGNAIKSNPMPMLLIGAGVAWMIYESRRKSSDDLYAGDYDDDTELYGESPRDYSSPDYSAEYDRPLEYGSSASVGSSESSGSTYRPGGYQGESGLAGETESKLGEAKDRVVAKASQAKRQVKEKLSRAGEVVREKTQDLGRQAKDLGHRVQDSAKEAYGRTRERVATTAQEHPLELGLGILAAGVVAGLLLPTPEKVNRLAGPAVDRLRERTRNAGSELLHKGQRVAAAATTAVKNEAEAQGLTLESLKEKTGAVADKAKSAVADSARQEGLNPDQGKAAGSGTTGSTNPAPAVPPTY